MSSAFGILAVYLLVKYAFYSPSALINLIANVFVFGYLPIAVVVSPLLVALFAAARYGNTQDVKDYFIGSLACGIAFTLILAVIFLFAVLASIPA